MKDDLPPSSADPAEAVSASMEMACNRFEAAWKAGEEPRIEDYLPGKAGPERVKLLRALLMVELVYRRDPDLEEYRCRFPDLAADVGEMFYQVQAWTRAPDPALGNQNSLPAGQLTTTDSADRPAAADGNFSLGPSLPTIPGYEILDELGRGGMGVVFRARQLALKRLVALKMILAGSQAGPALVARFRREQEAVARLQHPHIVQIYEIGEHAGQPFCALEYVDGGSLDRKLAGRPLPFQEGARLAEILARAVQHAHEQGIIHRDLKPGNVLLTASGQPKIADFGLAKQLDNDSGQTQTGQVMGTPCYMAPEQAGGQVRATGVTTDVWALGALLYEMLTGQPPFKGPNTLATLEQVLTCDPTPLRKLRAEVPRDLETICLKCLQKDPDRRYPSSLALAQDLESFRAGEPIRARPESVFRKLGRRLRRHRVGVAAAMGVALALAVAVVAGGDIRKTRRVVALQNGLEAGLDLEPAQWTRAHLEALEAAVADLEPLDPIKATGYRQRVSDRFRETLVQAISEPRLEPDAIARLEQNLQALTERAPDEALVIRRRFQQRLSDWETLFELAAPFADVNRVFPRGEALADETGLTRRPPPPSKSPGPPPAPDPVVLTAEACVGNGQMEVRFDASWQEVGQVGLLLNCNRGHSQEVRALAWAPDGRLLATAGTDSTVRLWDVSSSQEIRALAAGSDVKSVAIDRLGSYLVAATEKGLIRFDLQTGQHETIPAPAGNWQSVVFSPDGRWLAAGRSDGRVLMFDPADWQVRATLAGSGYTINQLAFTSNGRTLAAASQDLAVRFWDAPDFREKTWTARHAGPVPCLAFGPDGTLATLSSNQVTLWDVDAGKMLRQITSTLSPTQKNCLAFAPGGSHLALGQYLWDLRAQKGEDWLMNLVRDGRVVAYSPDGGRLAIALSGGPVQLVDPARKALRGRLTARRYAFVLTATSEADRRVLGSDGGKLLLGAGRQGAPLYLQILRNDRLLREQALPVPAGPLTLRARRVGDTLSFQANDLTPLTFHDAFPLPGPGGFYGVYWPPGPRLTYLEARCQTLPLAPGPLERGDDLLARGQNEPALAVFQQLALTGGGPPAVVQEARFKAGKCLAELNRPEEAAAGWEQLAAEAGDRWPLLAATELWALRLRQKRWEEAEVLFTNVASRYRFEELAAVVPEEDRQPLLREYTLGGADWVMFVAGMETRYERVVQVLDFLRAAPWDRLEARKNLMRAYQLLGRDRDAIWVAEDFVRVWSASGMSIGQNVVVELAILLRQNGQPERAMDELRRVQSKYGNHQDTLLEQARTAIALGAMGQAEKFLDQCLAVVEKSRAGSGAYGYRGAWLARGFLREQQGDAAGALAAWRQGYLGSRRGPEVGENIEDWRDPAANHLLLYQVILGSLSGEMTDAEADQLLSRSLNTIKSDYMPSGLLANLNLPRGLLLHIWRTPRGREYARKIAFRSLPFSEVVRGPAYLMVAEVGRKGAFNEPSAEEDELLWQAVVGSFELFYSAKINRVQVLQLGLTWKGTSNILGWGAVESALPAERRGPLAYVFGNRYLRLNKRAEAERFFRTARNDASAGSTLERLAKAELERLKSQ